MTAPVINDALGRALAEGLIWQLGVTISPERAEARIRASFGEAEAEERVQALENGRQVDLPEGTSLQRKMPHIGIGVFLFLTDPPERSSMPGWVPLSADVARVAGEKGLTEEQAEALLIREARKGRES